MSVSRTVSEILSIKEWPEGFFFKRSLKMALFDRSYTTFHWSAIVSIALCCTVFELFNVELLFNYSIELLFVTLKYGL